MRQNMSSLVSWRFDVTFVSIWRASSVVFLFIFFYVVLVVCYSSLQVLLSLVLHMSSNIDLCKTWQRCRLPCLTLLHMVEILSTIHRSRDLWGSDLEIMMMRILTMFLWCPISLELWPSLMKENGEMAWRARICRLTSDTSPTYL
jgi:hypothetical protein